ncbi:MAG TPA: glucose 1-dehydrogenase [Syntrophales bacterium]|nr:glucose 1-dehydrogenase [Syntrophales bacterium]
MKLKDRIAMITGGGTGIGRAIALGFAGEGAKVVIATEKRTFEAAQKTAAEIKNSGGDSLALEMDLTKTQQVKEAVRQAIERFGRIEILVNNAAAYPATPFLEITEEEWLRVIDVNLNGVFRITQLVAKDMVARRYGKIINVASSQAIIGVALMSHYTAAKGGLIALTKALAAELSPHGINVNAFAPGLTRTPLVQEVVPKEYYEAWEKAMVMGRCGAPEDYVGIAVLLASEAGNYITGETIAVDGGCANVFARLSG